LQKRLPPLLRMNGITTIEAANRWLAEVYIEQHNARFAVAAAEEGTAFIPFVGELENILCIEQERVAGLDNTVRYEGRCLQIPPNRPGAAKALSFPVVQDPEAPPIRPERHVENSIATMRKRLTVALDRSLYRCPCCQSFMQKPPHYRRL